MSYLAVDLMSEERLENAIRSNDLSLLQNLLSQGVEINHQDNNGNTVFHNAIRMDAHMDILKELLLNGSDVNIVNKKHLSSISFAFFYGSDDIIYKLFALDHIHIVNYDDRNENSFLHLLPKRSNLTESFMESLKDFQLNINSINKSGDTPIHIVCKVIGRLEKDRLYQMKLFLDTFDGFDPFICNNGGDTFLHSCFDSIQMDDNDVDFINCLFGGGFRHITKEVTARLLKYKNNIGNTPLHILTMNVAVQERPGTSLIILQKCFAAGVDINCTNNLGETALHLLIQSSRPEYTFTKENEQFLRCLLENRADINLQNVFGISPIFQCWNCDVMSVLLEMGADLNTQDKFGRTPLLAMFIYRPSAEEIEQLLVKDACLNQRDFHGNNALHYAVWHALDLETIFYMINNGIESTQDKQGILPCELALQRQNRKLFCILSEEGNIIYQRYMFEFQEHIIEYKDLVSENFEEIARVSRCLNLSSDDAFTKLLGLPYIGRVSSEDEANLIRIHVTNLIKEIGRKLEGREKIFSNSIVQSGSIGEETKICYPDEFDFVCILNMFGKVCERDEGFCGESGFTVLKLKENTDQSNFNLRWFFDRNGRLNVNAVRVRFAQLVREILYDPEIWTSPFISFHFFTNQDYKDEEILPTCQFSINWVGHRYKDLIIKIDLVPACQIANWWPENTDLQKISCNVEKLQKDGCLLLFQCTEIFQQSEVKLRVSALPAEKMHLGTISKTAIDSYMFSKLLCTDWVCLVIVIGQESFMVNEFITSYMLKNCTFHVFHDNKMKGIAIEDIKSFTVQIFKTLLTFCETGNFPAFTFPFQNIFTFQCKQPIESIRKKCIYRSICAKIILTILGEKQIFTELSNEDIINTILESGSDNEFSIDECQDAVEPLELFSNHSDFEGEKKNKQKLKYNVTDY